MNLPHVPKPIGELDLGIRFNLSIFDILNWNATEISSCSLSLEFCVIFFYIFMFFRSCFCKFF